MWIKTKRWLTFEHTRDKHLWGKKIWAFLILFIPRMVTQRRSWAVLQPTTRGPLRCLGQTLRALMKFNIPITCKTVVERVTLLLWKVSPEVPLPWVTAARGGWLALIERLPADGSPLSGGKEPPPLRFALRYRSRMRERRFFSSSGTAAQDGDGGPHDPGNRSRRGAASRESGAGRWGSAEGGRGCCDGSSHDPDATEKSGNMLPVSGGEHRPLPLRPACLGWWGSGGGALINSPFWSLESWISEEIILFYFFILRPIKNYGKRKKHTYLFIYTQLCKWLIDQTSGRLFNLCGSNSVFKLLL